MDNDVDRDTGTDAATDPGGTHRAILGIDIGGSGIKGALVDVDAGELVTERHRIPTPKPATPEAVGAVVAEIVEHFDYQGPIGCTFPAVVQHGHTLTAANVDDSWIGAPAAEILSDATGLDVTLLNDADAAGVAEMAFGEGRGVHGTVMMLTFGTGIGSALFIDGVLVPNTELGHIEYDGREAEPWAADRARKEDDLSWKKWGKRVNAYLGYLEMLFHPELFILGGGSSKKFHKFRKKIKIDTKVVPAALKNEAGIVGAAWAVRDRPTGRSG